MKHLKQYDKYKPSGVDWLGDVPEHWEVLRANYIFDRIDERSKTGNEELLSVSEHHGVRPRSVSNVSMFMAASYVGYKLCEKGDLVINSLWAWSRGLGISKYSGIISTAYSVFRIKNQKEYDENYLNYLLRIEEYVTQYLILSKGVWISRLQLADWSFLRIPILSPPKTEQTAIANYLDRKTAQIDAAIAQKERLIELLQERQQIVIHQAVTQGLDSTVEMKDSGVEWIGEVPRHWEVLFNRRLFRENSRKITSDNELPLSLSQKDGVVPSDKLKEKRLSPAHRKNFKLCYPGDLIVNRFKGHLGVFFETPYRGIVTFHYGVFEPEIEINTKYYELLFHTSVYKTIYAGASNGMTVGLQNISNQNFYDVKSLFPPQKEQNMIVEFCDSIKEETKSAVSKQKALIKSLKEYKTVMIDAAVTGKVRIVD